MNTLNRKLYLPLLLILVLLLAACVPVAPMPVAEPTAAATAVPMAEPTIEEVTATDSVTRETGATVTVPEKSGDVTVHSYLAPEQVFASNTHILELPNSLVLIDAQFLLPNAMDFRADADSLGKPIDRSIITHAHPDHFLGAKPLLMWMSTPWRKWPRPLRPMDRRKSTKNRRILALPLPASLLCRWCWNREPSRLTA